MSSSTEYISQFEKDHKVSRLPWLVWGGAVVLVLVWMGAIVGAPVALAHGYGGMAMVIYKGFSPLCHQISERSFHVEGHAFAVCARCTGIYAGFAAGLIFYPLIRSLTRTDTPARKWLFVAVVPLFLDWLLGLTGIWANTHLSRFLTGAILGGVCALFVVPGLMDLFKLDWRSFFANSGSRRDPHGQGSAIISREPAMPGPLSQDPVVQSDFGSPTSRI